MNVSGLTLVVARGGVFMADAPERQAWHPAFCAAASFELREDLDAVEIISEYNLNKEPIRADLLIIKKDDDRIINNEIGKIFKRHNIIEYKNPEDSLNIDDFYKTIGYACIYKSLAEKVNMIPVEDITVSIFRAAYPRRLFLELKKSGYKIEEKYPGVFYIFGATIFGVQIVVTNKLDFGLHSGFRILSTNVKKEDAEKFLDIAKRCNDQGDRNNINAILQVSVSANAQVYEEIRRNTVMCQALRELMKDEIDEEINQAVEKAVEKVAVDTERNIKFEAIKNIMEELKVSSDRAMEILRIPEMDRVIYLSKLG